MQQMTLFPIGATSPKPAKKAATRRKPAAKKAATKKVNGKALLAQYNRNQDINYHSENLLLLAKNFGSKADVSIAEKILDYLKKNGSAPAYGSALQIKGQALSKKLYPKLLKAANSPKKAAPKKAAKKATPKRKTAKRKPSIKTVKKTLTRVKRQLKTAKKKLSKARRVTTYRRKPKKKASPKK